MRKRETLQMQPGPRWGNLRPNCRRSTPGEKNKPRLPPARGRPKESQDALPFCSLYMYTVQAQDGAFPEQKSVDFCPASRVRQHAVEWRAADFSRRRAWRRGGLGAWGDGRAPHVSAGRTANRLATCDLRWCAGASAPGPEKNANSCNRRAACVSTRLLRFVVVATPANRRPAPAARRRQE